MIKMTSASFPFQVLIVAHQPPYELRYNQVESIFLSAIDGASFLTERLEQLIKSGTAIFDILPSFFYHRNLLVRVAALEVGAGECVHGSVCRGMCAGECVQESVCRGVCAGEWVQGSVCRRMCAGEWVELSTSTSDSLVCSRW